MYWPLGAPRIYAASRRKRKPHEPDKEDDTESEGETNHNTAVLGLQVARNGHLFTTITDTALTVWQSSVRKTMHVDTEF